MNNDVETSLFEKHGDGNSLVSLSINSHQGVVRHRKEIAEYLQKLDEVISKYGASKLWIFAGQIVNYPDHKFLSLDNLLIFSIICAVAQATTQREKQLQIVTIHKQREKECFNEF